MFLTQELLTAIVELEVMTAVGFSEQPLVVPDGVTVELRHFLTVPSAQFVRDELEGDGHAHQLVKITKVGDGFEKEIIDSQTEVLSPYFGSDKLQGKPLCYLAWASRARCSHMSAPRNIIVTRQMEICAHKTMDTDTLSVYAYCEAASKDRFLELIRKQGQERTHAVMEEIIGPKDTFEIRVRAGVQLTEALTHLKLCQFNGALREDLAFMKVII